MARQTTARKARTGSARAAGDGNGKAPAKASNETALKKQIADLERRLAEANAGNAADDVDLDDLGRRRQEQIRALLDPRDHMRDCPMDGRVEAYGARKPAKPDQAIPAADVTVVRCVECAGSLVLDEPFPDVVARLQAELGEGD